MKKAKIKIEEKIYDFDYMIQGTIIKVYSGNIYTEPDDIYFTMAVKNGKIEAYTPLNFKEEFFYQLLQIIKLNESLNF